VDKNAEIKKQLNNEINSLETNQAQLHSKCEHILQQSRSNFSLIKNEINNRTTELINIILKDQEKLLNEITSTQSSIENKTVQLLENNKNFKLEMESIRKDFNNFDTNELNTLKNNLNKLKSDLDYKMKYLSDISCEYKIKLNNNYLTLGQSNLIGCINQSNLNRTDSNELVLSGSWDNMVKVWNAKTGECLSTLRSLR